MFKKLVFAVFILSLGASALALDFSLRPGGFAFIPAGPGNKAADGNERFDTGGGGALGFDIDLSSIWPNRLGLGYTAGIEGGLLYTPFKQPASGNAQTYSFGGALGFYYFPLSRLFTRIDGAIGMYQSVIEEGKGKPGLWWRAGGEAGFRFTPAFTLAAGGGWRQYQSGASGVFNSGVSAALTLHITFETGGGSGAGGAGAVFTQDDGVYPAFLPLYQQNPAGTITIRNDENAEIRDVRVSFRAAGYTASEFPCGTLPLIARGRSGALPLYADFSPDLLRFTDTGRILGEVVIRYRFLGKEKQSVQTAAIQVHNRNVFAVLTPSEQSLDWVRLAAFVSPASPEVLEYAKHITGLARSNRRTGLNQNMQAALWLFEGLLAGGVRLRNENNAASALRGGEKDQSEGWKVVEVQFPAETLGFRTGNRTDLGLLWAAALEASGIPCAIIPLEPERGSGDFIIAYHLGVGQAGAELLFNGLDRVLVIDGEVWMPLSMNAFNEGFTAAWDGGVEALNRAFAADAAVDFIMLEDAWGTYPPAPLPAQGGGALRAGEGDLAQRADRVIGQYIAREIQPQVEALQRRIMAAPAGAGLPLAGLYNRLGILLIRSGRAADARAAYERAAGMGSVPAMTNRGNLALIERDYVTAEKWFTQTLAREPENTTALKGLAQIEERGE